jgi:hypothetical protein
LCFKREISREEGRTGSALVGGEVAQTIYTHASKCKIKGERKNK